jgi:archaetidylinositol phosphate synthase
VHKAITAGAEKRLLVWIAERLPEAINSDHLTFAGAVALLGVGAGYWAGGSALLLVIPLLVVNWLGDSLDGTLARVRHRERPRYGYYVDHVIDLFGTAVLIGGMALSGLMTAHVALALLAAYFLVSAETFLATHTVHVFRLSFAAIGPTELRILLAIGAVAVFLHPFSDIGGQRYLLLDVSGVIAVAGLVAVFLLSSLRNTRALYRAEPLPRHDVGRAA